MNRRAIELVVLRSHVAVMRLGLPNVLAVLLLGAGIFAWSWALPFLRSQLESEKEALRAAQRSVLAVQPAAPTPAVPPDQERLAQFYNALGDQRNVEQQIKTLFALARESKLNLLQGEYKSRDDTTGGYHTYQLILPVKGPYGALRRFCENALSTIPFASLDVLSFKREQTANGVLDAKLQFTLYLTDQHPSDHADVIAAVKDGAQ